MKEPTIAEVLHLAADEYLSNGYWSLERFYERSGSCDAIELACRALANNRESHLRLQKRIFKGLRNLGLKVNSFTQFDSVKSDRQGARYAWLKFAAMIAEEQGV